MTQVLLLIDDLKACELVESFVLDFKRSGFNSITLTSSKPLAKLQDYFVDYEPEGVNISFLEMGQGSILDAIKELFQAISCSDILLVNGNNYFSFDFSWFIKNCGADYAMALRLEENHQLEEAIHIDEDFLVDPDSDIQTLERYVDAGVYYLKKSLLQIDFKTQGIMAELAEKKVLKGIPCGGKVITESSVSWLDKEAKPCLFLDRDGIIIEDTGYPHIPEELKILEGIIPLINWANDNDWLVIVLTNQAGIAKGKFPEVDFYLCMEHLDMELGKKSATIDDWFFCPFHEQGSVPEFSKASLSRKPHPGLALLAMKEYKIDLNKSFMIGDKKSDSLRLPGLRTLFLRGQYDLEGASPIFDNHEQILEEIRG